MTRRDLFRGLFALPAAVVLAPLAKLFGIPTDPPATATVAVANSRRGVFVGSKAADLFVERFERGFVKHLHRGPFPDSFVHPDRYGTIAVPKCPNPTRRVRIENGPILWEESK